MKSIFLSASVPVSGRGDYHQTADPLLIERAVQALVAALPRGWKVVWGGHPSITPLVWSTLRGLEVDPAGSAVLYESKFFEGQFPAESGRFPERVLVEAVPDDQAASLLRLRREMLARKDLAAAVFIGGMAGVEIEHSLFRRFHPKAKVLLVPATGGAALRLAEWSGTFDETALRDADFAALLRSMLT